MTDADVQVHSWLLSDNKGQPACNPSHCLSNLWIRNMLRSTIHGV